MIYQLVMSTGLKVSSVQCNVLYCTVMYCTLDHYSLIYECAT